MKNILIIFVITLLIIFAFFYLKPTQISDLIGAYNDDNLPNKIIAYVYTPFSTKQYEVNKYENIKEIINVIENIKVRNKLIITKTYVPEFKNTYNFSFYDSNNEVQNIYIFNRKYIKINNKYYYIIGMPNLSVIYDMIVID